MPYIEFSCLVSSACYGYQDQWVMIAAASDALWNNGAACGKMYSVSCTRATNQGVPQPCKGGGVTMKIVDRCPSPGCQATIDLSQEAFLPSLTLLPRKSTSITINNA
ncbi:hypothetical protein ACSBR2_025351 [Camellia fascicularis]